MEIKQKIADEVNKFQELRDQCKKIMLQHKKMEVKLSELKVVKEVNFLFTFISLLILYANFFKELDLLEDSARTYKLTGPALMKVELKDAKNTVNERIKYISDEM